MLVYVVLKTHYGNHELSARSVEGVYPSMEEARKVVDGREGETLHIYAREMKPEPRPGLTHLVAKFVLRHDDRSLPVDVEECGTFLNIRPSGYGNPVSLDFYEGKLRLLVNADPDEEEPLVIDLEGAKEEGE